MNIMDPNLNFDRTVQGVVKKVKEHHVKKRGITFTQYIATISFTINDTDYSDAFVSNSPFTWRIGQKITLEYDSQKFPRHPLSIQCKKSHFTFMNALYFIIAIIMLMAIITSFK